MASALAGPGRQVSQPLAVLPKQHMPMLDCTVTAKHGTHTMVWVLVLACMQWGKTMRLSGSALLTAVPHRLTWVDPVCVGPTNCPVARLIARVHCQILLQSQHNDIIAEQFCSALDLYGDY